MTALPTTLTLPPLAFEPEPRLLAEVSQRKRELELQGFGFAGPVNLEQAIAAAEPVILTRQQRKRLERKGQA